MEILPDQESLAIAPFERELRAQLRLLVTEPLIQSYLAHPEGPHGDALQRLLTYFRRAPVAGKYALLMEVPFKAYRIVKLSGRRGLPPVRVDDRVYTSQREAEKAVFLRRVQDMLAAEEG